MRQLIVRAGSACPLFKLATLGLAMALTFFACSNDALAELQGGGLSSDSGDVAKICGNEEYDSNIYHCDYGELVGKCNGVDYRPLYQVCNNGRVEDKNPLSSSLVQGGSSSSSSSSVLGSSSSSLPNSSSSQSSNSLLSSSSRVCKSNDLGKGYDVVGSPYINWTKVTNIAVLDQNKMCQDGILELDKDGSAQQYALFSGSTIKEFYSKRNENMKISASLDGDIDIAWIFSAEFDVKFAMKTNSGSQQNVSKEYYYSQIRSYLYTGEDQIKSNSASAQNLSKYLTSDFISDLKSTKTPGSILDRYGSHIFIHYFKGGSLEANYTYLGSESSSRFTSASQMELAAKGSFMKIDGGISYGTNTSNEQAVKELEQHMSFYYETYGGKSLKAQSITQLGNEYGSWVASINNQARTTGIKDFAQSFIPIWDLAQQVEGVASTRIDALKDEFKKRAKAQGLKFPVEDIPCTPTDNNSTHYCSNGFLKEYGKVADADGKTYKTVVIGTQTWMAENLNYNATGSKCGDGDILSATNNLTCNNYGRLYDWMTAMALPSNCYGSICVSQISAKHKGICPTGYHIPTNTDWDNLYRYAGETEKTSRYLKATVGWANCGNSSSYTNKCEDKYGFSALPGGYGTSQGTYSTYQNAGYTGRWWSATENNANYAHYRRMYNNDAYVGSDYDRKDYFYSVRCLKD
ncbi:MAG: hypothetical protein FWF67_01375 [Fibromonadales bacterium]|nr:hypothetical protein [Fibromonadales bacterium]